MMKSKDETYITLIADNMRPPGRFHSRARKYKHDPSRQDNNDKSPYTRVFILAAGGGRCDVSVTGVVTVFVTLSGIMSSLSRILSLRASKEHPPLLPLLTMEGADDNGHWFTVSQGPDAEPDLSKQICDKSSYFKNRKTRPNVLSLGS